MNDLNLGPNSGRVKCAKICGDTSGNYHPHGETTIYPTLVRMAQEWSMRHVLVDKQGNFWIVGRLDDVLNVSGHRLGTAEVESALVSHPDVAEAAVVGRPHEIKGQGIAAFVTLKEGVKAGSSTDRNLKAHVAKAIGAIARPDEIHLTPALPKTRSGKIMRRILKELVATGGVTGNIMTLEDFSVVSKLQKNLKK